MNKKTIIVLAIAVMLLLPLSMSAENIIKKFEGKRLKAYQDGKGVWTIGYGTTYHYDLNRKVQQGDSITEDTAIKWLNLHTDKIRNYLDKAVKVVINDNQKNALISLIYNIGQTNFADSTLLKKLNTSKPKQEVADQFLRWNKIKVNGIYQVSEGLTSRRKKEYDLFLK